jgi:hypothetical protein
VSIDSDFVTLLLMQISGIAFLSANMDVQEDSPSLLMQISKTLFIK